MTKSYQRVNGGWGCRSFWGMCQRESRPGLLGVRGA